MRRHRQRDKHRLFELAHVIDSAHAAVELLAAENEAQAQKRCLDPQHNRGLEAAHTALAMTQVMRDLAKASAEYSE